MDEQKLLSEGNVHACDQSKNSDEILQKVLKLIQEMPYISQEEEERKQVFIERLLSVCARICS